MSIWWLFVWRGMLGGFVAGAVAGALTGLFGAILGYAREDVVFASSALGGLAGLIWGIVVVRMMLKKRYRGFRIALIAPNSYTADAFS
jgi:LytS/YehU family sensor histidine kinase